MTDINKMLPPRCPSCGADTSCFSTEDIAKNRCSYCGRELVDLSREKYDNKIKQVKKSKKKMVVSPVIAAAAVGATLILLVIIAAVIYTTRTDQIISRAMYGRKPTRYTKKMEKAYEKEDWDELYDLVIDDVEDSINSPYYFTYRTAWLLSYYPSVFDEAYESGDNDGLMHAYDIIYNDYHLRDDGNWVDGVYEKVPEIEEALEREYERETKIVESLGD